MAPGLLSTKLFIPPPRPDIVPRHHLSERLNEGVTRKLTIICAPAGFGKTTLLSEWVGSCGTPIAWLSLDKGDNDLARFLAYIVAAIQTIEPSICETVLAMTQAPQVPPIEFLLTEMINEVAGISQDFVLILDDYHVIDDQAIQSALAFLIAYLPPKMHLIIASRSDPFLPLSRLRADGQMTELRTDDLRFSTQEAVAYLNQVMALTLDGDDVIALKTRTEGWIAGLHLAALSLQGKRETSEFITAFAGDDRYIVDYLVDEVLEQRPKGTRDFLVHTSILDQMNGSLCDAVTGLDGGQNVLEKLDQANLFIEPLDNQRRWYRYHHLFADLLLHRLERTKTSQEINSLHQRASQWYEENNHLVEAVDHAMKAGDHENAIRLITENGAEMLMGSQHYSLLRWQAELPPDLLASQPKLCMVLTWACVATGSQKEAESYLQMIERALGADMEALISDGEEQKTLDAPIRAALLEVAVVRAELAIEKGNIADALKLSNLVLSSLEEDEESYFFNPPKDSLMVVNFILGLIHKITGEFRLSYEELTKAAILGQEQGNVHIVAGAYGRVVSVQVTLGHLQQGVQTCQTGLKLLNEMDGEHSPISGLLKAELGNLLYEQNDLENAQKQIQEAIAVAKPWGFLEAFVPAYTGLARLRVAQGDFGGAFAALDELAEHGKSNPVMVSPVVELFRAKLWVARGQVQNATQWAQDNDIPSDGEISNSRLDEYLILARILIAQDQLDQTVDLLSRMVDMTEKAALKGETIEILVLLALAFQAKGKNDSALSSLERALILAEPEGYVRTFVDEGESMVKLLRQAASRDFTTEYIERLLGEFEHEAFEKQSASAQTLTEPLSERELEVLHLLKTELSGPEIASELSIALTTMRFHTRNIYSKLNVNNRRRAIHKAEELNLI